MLLLPGLRVAIWEMRQSAASNLPYRDLNLQALDLAVRKEKDTIVFFTGLKGFMKDSSEHHNVDLIIGEEIQQISHLEQARQQLFDAKTANVLGDADRSRKTCIRCGKLACSGHEYDLLLKT